MYAGPAQRVMVERQRGSQDCADRGNAMARSASLTVSASVTRLALGFVAGFLATITFQQIGIWALHAVGYDWVDRLGNHPDCAFRRAGRDLALVLGRRLGDPLRADRTLAGAVSRRLLGRRRSIWRDRADIGFDVCCLSPERASARRWIRAQPDRHLPDRPCLVGARHGDVSWCPDGLAQPAQGRGRPALLDDAIGAQQQRLRDLDPH